MIELRWLYEGKKPTVWEMLVHGVWGKPRTPQLQFRYHEFRIGSEGALHEGIGWSEWKDVPIIMMHDEK